MTLTSSTSWIENLPSEERSVLEQLVARFETAWQQGPRPHIDDYLGHQPTLRLALLVELVRTDLAQRLRAGEAARIQDYLDRFPELGEANLPLPFLAAEPSLAQLGDQHTQPPRTDPNGTKALKPSAVDPDGIAAIQNPAASPEIVKVPGYEVLANLVGAAWAWSTRPGI
jgi:hypothetical protein